MLTSIYQHVCDMHFRRMIHDEFMDLRGAQNHQHRSYFEDVFHGMYVEAQVLAIRRLTDSDSRTLSLHRLIGQVEQHRREFTREWFVARWMGDRDRESEDFRGAN